MPRLILFAALLLLPLGASAQQLDEETIHMAVLGGDLLMSATPEDFSGETATMSDRTRRIEFRGKYKGAASRTDRMKVVVETLCPGQRFSLRVVATGPTTGIPAPSVQLSDGMLPTDFIIDIQPNGALQSAGLTYEGTLTLNQGAGSDTHTITYSILEQ